MLKRTLAIILSTALFATATTIVIPPIDKASAEMAAPSTPTKKSTARERKKQCNAEWAEAKAGGKTEGKKKKQFISECNKRLKAM